MLSVFSVALTFYFSFNKVWTVSSLAQLLNLAHQFPISFFCKISMPTCYFDRSSEELDFSKLKGKHHIYPVMKHFYPDGRGLLQDDPTFTHRARRLTDGFGSSEIMEITCHGFYTQQISTHLYAICWSLW